MTKIVLILVMIMSFTSLTWSLPKTSKVKKDVIKSWKKRYPKQKILEISKSGEVSKKTILVKAVKRIEYGVPMKVKVKTSKGIRTFNITAIYICNRSGKSCRYDDFNVGASTLEAKEGQDPPTEEEFNQLFQDALLKRYTFGKYPLSGIKAPAKIIKVTPLDKTYKNNGDKYWYVYSIALQVVDSTDTKYEIRAIDFAVTKENATAKWEGDVRILRKIIRKIK